MKFSEQWLRSLANPPVSRDALVARLSMSGLEVDAVNPVAADFSGVVVGEVVSVEPHPDAERLRVCQVSDGTQTQQVVCGAPNVRPGLKVPFATLGAVLPENFKIKKAKLRGVESNGMLCSAAELKIGEDDDGLLELAADAPAGQDLRQYLGLNDASIEIDLTPNRGDCLSLTGLGREVAAIYGVPFNPVAVEPIPATQDEVRPVAVLAPAACPRYLGRVIRNVDLSRPTPAWMVERLRRSDVRSIDPAVDVTNYVMLELGQPLHAFDLAQIDGGIRVRLAEAGEKLVLLDGREVALTAKTLLIADHSKPLAIAGVMGGEHSGVSDNTRDLFLESAFFDSIALAGTARSYGLHTDASHRYERGVDYSLQRRAMERATALLLDIVGGEPGPVTEVASAAHLPKAGTIQLRAERVARMLGLEVPDAEIEAMLSGLGLHLSATEPGCWQVAVPSHRFDLTLEVDLIEEVGRLYGYNRLPVRYPSARLAPTPRTEARAELPALKRLLAARGYQEAITYSFIDPKLFELFAPGVEPLKLANPISADLSVMRNSLWPSLVKTLQYNLNRHQSRVRLFESGYRFVGQLQDLKQEPMLAGIISGGRLPEGWNNGRDGVDFFDIKGDVQAVLAQAGAADDYRFEPAQHPALHPGQSAVVLRGEQAVGYLGALHPELARAMAIDQPVFLFELDLAAVAPGVLPAYRELSRFPEVRRDLALVVDKAELADVILADIRQQAGEDLVSLKLFDVYQGKGIDPDRKSLAVGLTWQHPSRTLTDDEVNAKMQNVINSLARRFNASLRK